MRVVSLGVAVEEARVEVGLALLLHPARDQLVALDKLGLRVGHRLATVDVVGELEVHELGAQQVPISGRRRARALVQVEVEDDALVDREAGRREELLHERLDLLLVLELGGLDVADARAAPVLHVLEEGHDRALELVGLGGGQQRLRAVDPVHEDLGRAREQRGLVDRPGVDVELPVALHQHGHRAAAEQVLAPRLSLAPARDGRR